MKCCATRKYVITLGFTFVFMCSWISSLSAAPAGLSDPGINIPFAASSELCAAVTEALKSAHKKCEDMEAELQRFLEVRPEKDEEKIESYQLNLRRRQRVLRAKSIAEAVQPYFQSAMSDEEYASAKDIALWQFTLMRQALTHYFITPNHEYSSTPAEIVPYFKNLGRVHTALQEWDKAVVSFGINFTVKSNDAMIKALCTAAALAAENGKSHHAKLALALLPFVQKACDEEEWNEAEALSLWQVDLQLKAVRSSSGVLFKEYNENVSLLTSYYCNLGLIVKELGSEDKAIEYFEKALAPLYSSRSEVNSAAKILPALELAKIAKSRNDARLAHFRSSDAYEFMERMREVNILYATETRQILIWSLAKTGQYGKALQINLGLVDFLKQCRLEDDLFMAQALHTLGDIHLQLGDIGTAQESYAKALQIYQSTQQPQSAGQATILAEKARFLNFRRQNGKAISLEEAIPLSDAGLSSQLKDAASTYALLVELYLEEGQIEKSRPLHERLVSICTTALRAPNCDRSMLNLLLGESLLHLGRHEEALEVLQAAYAEQYLQEILPVAFRCSELLMQANSASGNLNAAVFWGKLAVTALQEMRADQRRISVDMQRTFLQTQSGAYHTLIDILHTQGRTLEAEHIYSMLKVDELRQFIPTGMFREVPDQYPPLVGIEENLKTLLLDCVLTVRAFSHAVNIVEEWDARVEYPEFRNRTEEPFTLQHAGVVSLTNGEPQYLSADNMQIMRDILHRQDPDLSYQRNYPENVIISKERLDALRQRLDTELCIMRSFLKGIPQALATWSPPSGQEYLQKAVRNLDEKTVLLHMVSTANTLWVWISSSGGKTLKVHNISIPRQVLIKRVEELRTIVTERKLDPRPAAKQLYDIIFAPVEEELQKMNPTTVLFSLDGALRYIPPGILYDGKQWLVERYALGLFLEVSKDRLEQRPINWTVGGLGLTESRGEFSPLPNVKRELDGIVRDASNPNGVIPGKYYLNDNFTEKSLQALLGEKMSILHVATHFKLASSSAEESFLLLGDGSKLSLTRLAGEDFSFDSLQQITLSACETGANLVGSGSEIESLGALVQRKGAQSVLAALWSISDSSTSAMMPLFYKKVAMDGLPRAEALRQAQLAMIKGEFADDESESQRGGETQPLRRRDFPGYSHPYYWGAFILMGNWR